MKRYIHSSIHEGYTNLITGELPDAVQEFMDSEEDEIDYDLVKKAVSAYNEEYNMFPSDSSLDIKYDEDKARFYKKYRAFADKCKAMYNGMKRPSGYGRNDYILIKMRNMLNGVPYSFPYGWKYF